MMASEFTREIMMKGRIYRVSTERHNSGRPQIMQRLNRYGQWRDVRNMDTSDLLFIIVDGCASPVLA